MTKQTTIFETGSLRVKFCPRILVVRVIVRKTLTSGLGLDDMSLAWPAVVQLLVFIYSGIQ